MASPQNLIELMDMRILLESEGARQSMLHGDIEWEARLSAAHYKLAHLESRMHETGDIQSNIPIWTRVDWEFHDTLLSECPSQVLRQVHRNIYERFRLQVVATLRNSGFRDETLREHEAILKAAIARDPDACAVALRNHLEVAAKELTNMDLAV